MSVGTSDGRTFGSDFDLHVQPFLSTSSLEQEDNPEDQSGMQRRDLKDQRRGLEIDQTHHVPLVASAIMGQDGQMVGMAVDHRLKLSDDDKELLALHEGTELPYMNDLVKGGMSGPEAYAEAHKWATARETAASIAKWGQEGHEAYQQRMRDNAAIAKEPSDQGRHPQAHTTIYGLDEDAGVYPKMAMNKPPIDPMNDNEVTDAPTPEMASHDRALHAAEEALPFAMTRALGQNAPLFGRPANQNETLQSRQDRGAPNIHSSELLKSSEPPKTMKEWEEKWGDNPELVKYVKALNKQQKSEPKRKDVLVGPYKKGLGEEPDPSVTQIKSNVTENLIRSMGNFAKGEKTLDYLGLRPKPKVSKSTTDQLREWFKEFGGEGSVDYIPREDQVTPRSYAGFKIEPGSILKKSGMPTDVFDKGGQRPMALENMSEGGLKNAYYRAKRLGDQKTIDRINKIRDLRKTDK